MPTRDRVLALFVVVLWGLNFIAMHPMLDHFPPLFVGSLRFLVIAVPAILFIPRPKVPLRLLIGFGLGFGTGQFAFLFIALTHGMPTGLASLVLQCSAPFTVVLCSIFLHEPLSGRQLTGILAAVAGMVVIAWHRAENAALLPVLLTMLGALCWACGNIFSRKSLQHESRPNPIHFTLWMSVVPPIPMYLLSLVFEGPQVQWRSLTTLGTGEGLLGLAGFCYVVLIGTVLGSSIWTVLMRRNPANVVAPFSLLVPVVGMTAAFVLLDETPALVEVLAGAVVVAGVLFGSLPRRRQRSAGSPTELVSS